MGPLGSDMEDETAEGMAEAPSACGKTAAKRSRRRSGTQDASRYVKQCIVATHQPTICCILRSCCWLSVNTAEGLLGLYRSATTQSGTTAYHVFSYPLCEVK